MRVIAIAGLPGSGKSTLLKELQQEGYSLYDDINLDWSENLAKVRDDVQQGKPVALSDIMFCDASFRQELERKLAMPVTWIFFENNPWQCAKNCVHRFLAEERESLLTDEVRKVRDLSKVYQPNGKTRPVARADAARS